MLAAIGHGTGKVRAHHGKHSGSKLKQEGGLLQSAWVKHFTVVLF